MQALVNDSGEAEPMTGAMKRALMDKVEAYGDHHTLRCLALASRAMPPSSDQVLLTCPAAVGWYPYHAHSSSSA